MTENPDHTRRWLINVSGAALLSNVLPVAPASAQGAGAAKPAAAAEAAEGGGKAEPLSPVTVALAAYISGALDRELPAPVVAKTKMHVLDTIAAMISGSRLKAGVAAAHYVEALGGKPQATVIGTGLLTSTVNAALANGMAAHGDETDDSHLKARFHPGCGIVPAALATAEAAGRGGNDLLRAVALGYDIGARSIYALGFGALYTERHSTHSLSTTFGATAAAPPCCGSIRPRCATPSRSPPSRPPACPIGSATASMWRRRSISAAWGRGTASPPPPWWAPA